jgi:hypothetical protein
MHVKNIAILCLFALSGCATVQEVGPLPTKDQEFSRPLEELKATYPAIANYERRFPSIGHCADIDDVIAKLGEPNEIQTEWAQVPLLSIPLAVAFGGGAGGAAVIAIAYGIYPKQPKDYVWLRGKYKITARVLTDFSCQYKTRISEMAWQANL